MTEDKIIKTDFNFGWDKWQISPESFQLSFQYQKGDILDVGCGTCQLCDYLHNRGWRGKYYGIDIQKYDEYKYPRGINLIIGDALEVEFPSVDTVVLYNILEHVDEPVELLRKAIDTAKENILINIPKRNEEMWEYGVVEYHQLDKTHKHCGFSEEEIYKLVDIAGGKIRVYQKLERTNIENFLIGLWNNIIPRTIIRLFIKIFSYKTFYQAIWCEIVKK